MAVNSAAKKRSLGQWLKGYTGQKYTTTLLFLLIPVVLLVLFTVIPAINMGIYSFQKRDQLGVTWEWVGLDNYKRIFTDGAYLQTFANSIYYLIGSFVQQAFALLIATVLCSKLKFANLFKGVLFFPYMMNGIIMLFGGDPVRWLSEPNLVNICLVFASIWRYIGFDIIMYIGAIQSISPEIYEAADLDGANPWQRFWYIIFPNIRPIVGLQLILAIKGAVSVFEIPYIITEGKNGTSTFVIKTIETAFKYQKVGLASAMAIVLLAIILIVTAIQKAFFKEDK